VCGHVGYNADTIVMMLCVESVFLIVAALAGCCSCGHKGQLGAESPCTIMQLGAAHADTRVVVWDRWGPVWDRGLLATCKTLVENGH
jgi:hypothetical protein